MAISCTEKDPFPTPEAQFGIFTKSPETHLPVRFENRSLNASNFIWDFGDSTEVSTEIAPTHTYSNPGEYLVSLSALSVDEQIVTETKVLTIGERYLTGLYIININPKDGNGKVWDTDNTGPDVLMQFGPVDFVTEDELEGFFIESLNVGEFKTPIGISTLDLLTGTYKLENKDYFLLLEDEDIVSGAKVYIPMVELQFNPVVVDGESITEIKRDDGTGDLTIPFVVLDQYQFLIEFEIKYLEGQK